MKLYNSLTKQLEEFVPINLPHVGLYTCGPTVYDYAHIGHGRKYTYDDLLRRTLTYNGFEVKHVMNVTDVGHLVSDADEGEDKLEKGARKSGKSVWQVADMYTNDFLDMLEKLNILSPDILCKATDNIAEQIALTQRLLDRGFAYETPEAVYFDVSKFPRYDGLFGLRLDEKLVAVRDEVQTGSYKRSPVDFALWFKLVGRFADHTMRWESPWGWGFPGWHIECSAMSMKYLGETFDIHTGGIEHQMVHHPNEIAQSEAATGKMFVKYWVHYGFLNVDGAKMSKSLNNFYRVSDIEEKGFSPRALRYLYMTAHYRSPLNFTWSSMASAQSAYDKLREFVKSSKGSMGQSSRVSLTREKAKKLEEYRKRFLAAISDDLGFPQALTIVWEMLKSNIPDYDKYDQLIEWDQVLGLDLEGNKTVEVQAAEEIRTLARLREELRKKGKFVEADEVRVKLAKLGWQVEDVDGGYKLKKVYGK